MPIVATQLLDQFQDNVSTERVKEGVVVNSIRIRPMLCYPSTSDDFGGRWVLTGIEIFAYADICFRPEEARVTCSTNYGCAQWGFPFTRLAQFLKEKSRRDCDIEELYKHVNPTQQNYAADDRKRRPFGYAKPCVLRNLS